MLMNKSYYDELAQLAMLDRKKFIKNLIHNDTTPALCEKLKNLIARKIGDIDLYKLVCDSMII